MGRFRTRGHDAALGLVERMVLTARPPHALLLAGPERVGKTTLALDLAAGLLCLDPDPAARPCRACAACRKIDHGNHPDLHRLAPEGGGQQIRVGQVQSLATDLALLPLEGAFRIALVERAQRLNLDAQNALLKTLEEPPPAVVIILAADDTSALLPTVVSRCARVRLGPVATETIASLLADAGVADMVHGAALGRLSGGRPGVAVALARTPDAIVAQGRMARLLVDLLRAPRNRRLQAAADLIADGALLAAAAAGESGTGEPSESSRPARGDRKASPAERRAATAKVIAVWRDVARDLAVATHGGRRELRQHELLDDLSEAGGHVDGQRITRFLGTLDGLSRALDAYANPELTLDALLLAWPEYRAAA